MKVNDLPLFDVADYLENEEMSQAYLKIIMEENDPALLASTLGDIAKACGITQIVKDAGIGRESLYKALRPNAKPRYETISRMLNALGMKLDIVPIEA